jgi:hypothetical protein
LASTLAHADVLSERVVLEAAGAGTCPGTNAVQVRAVPLSADGKYATNTYSAYVVPSGYAVEITDLTFSLGWLKSVYTKDITVLAQNRQTHQQVPLYTHRFGPWSFRAADPQTLNFPLNASQYVSPLGTTHVSFSSGLLISDEARICIMLPTDANILDSATRIVLRGRLHKLDKGPFGGGNMNVGNLGSVSAVSK